ncbi:MAG: cytochrome c oxidase subunit II [Chloroflexota bacterium]|nr:cytochrome c oxidase subunit II [Chloroflexota bacterium]
MISLIVLTACGPEVEKPYTTISPASPIADDIQSLYKLVFWLALVVFVGVQFAIVYTALRFRRMKHSPTRPPQVHGNKRLEIIWTIIPAVVLLAILIPTITTLYDHDAAAEEGDIVVDVYGKQWWWEVHYGEDRTQGGQNLDIVTANEIRLPEGKEAIIRLHSNNVIHSFWVPRLSGKMDVIPGHANRMSITPTESGEYYGECAEFCGTQHAWMRFKIVVEPEDQFYSWVNAQRAGNLGTTDPEAQVPAGVTRAPESFNLCLSCHVVNGVNEQTLSGLEAPTNLGPNLTNLACRDTLAAGLLVNNRENLETWIDNPGGVKPGNYMADVITPGLIRERYGDDGFNALIDYLMGLQPAQGCNNENPGATPAASPVASPVAGIAGSD